MLCYGILHGPNSMANLSNEPSLPLGRAQVPRLQLHRGEGGRRRNRGRHSHRPHRLRHRLALSPRPLRRPSLHDRNGSRLIQFLEIFVFGTVHAVGHLTKTLNCHLLQYNLDSTCPDSTFYWLVSHQLVHLIVLEPRGTYYPGRTV